MVDDFGIKYTSRKDVEHLQDALTNAGYWHAIDLIREHYIRVILEWDYNKWLVILSMPGYVECTLQYFGHEYSHVCEDSLHA